MLRKEKSLRVDKMLPISKDNFEVVEKYQYIQQVVELKPEIELFKGLMKRSKKRRLS